MPRLYLVILADSRASADPRQLSFASPSPKFRRAIVQEKRTKVRAGLAPLVLLVLVAAGIAQEPKPAAQNSKQKAWQMLEDGIASDDVDKRVIAIRVLGLLNGDSHAIELSEKALKDKDEKVRAAGATALGELGAKGSIPKLHQALKDDDVGVVMAAAHALHAMGDPT